VVILTLKKFAACLKIGQMTQSFYSNKGGKMTTTLEKITYNPDNNTVTVCLIASRSSKTTSLYATAERYFMTWQTQNIKKLGYKSCKNTGNIRGEIIDQEHFYYSEVFELVYPRKKKNV